uniref:RING-type domain-containing protein n=1 Tax=Timema genevievae TaxID=629358 RepID=A0A7R9K506_TIMGE|nr:unnamed protein product [Timema genevievae]
MTRSWFDPSWMYLGKTTLSTPGRDSNLDLPALGSLAQYETSALDNYATEAEQIGTMPTTVLLVVLPVMFIASTFSTRPVEMSKYRSKLSMYQGKLNLLDSTNCRVEMSKYRGKLSMLGCAVLLSLSLGAAVQASSHIAILLVAVMCPFIAGIVPVEEKFRIFVRHTRIWGLSYAYLARLQGNMGFVKWYLMVERTFHLIHLQLDNVYVLGNLLLFYLLTNKLVSPKSFGLFFHMLNAFILRFIETDGWGRVKILLMMVQLLRIGVFSCYHTALNTLYLLSMMHKGIPGRDTRAVAVVRSLKLSVLQGMEEYWVPIAIHSAPVILSAVVILVSVQDPMNWLLCSLLWYTNVLVGALQTAEWYWQPIADLRAHNAQYPSSSHRERDWRGSCTICWEDMEPYTAQSTPCGHIFHSECLLLSLKSTEDTCPLCRWPLHSPLSPPATTNSDYIHNVILGGVRFH